MGVRAIASLLGLIGLGVGITMVVQHQPATIHVLQTGTLPEGTTHLDLSNTPTYRSQWNFKLKVRSNIDKGVRLAARIEDPAPAEWRVKLLQNEFLLPGGEVQPTLALYPSHKVGPFSGKVSLYTDDYPDWKYTWTFSGEVVDIPHEGARIVVRPSGFDLGNAKAGDVIERRFTLINDGDQPSTVHEIKAEDGRKIALGGFEPGLVLEPGARHEIVVTYTVPDTSGTVVFRLTLRSNARNAKVREIRARANVVPDYACNPPFVNWRNVYRRKQPVLTLKLTGVKPFRVTQVFSDRLFEEESLGTGELARQQTVKLRLKRDARLGTVEVTLRVRIEPAGVETKVPLRMVVTPAIFASPAQVRFGRVASGGAVVKRTVSFSSMDQRAFRITGVRSKGKFVAEPNNRANMTPTLVVYPVKNLRPGIHRDDIVVKTDHPDVPELIIPAFIEIR